MQLLKRFAFRSAGFCGAILVVALAAFASMRPMIQTVQLRTERPKQTEFFPTATDFENELLKTSRAWFLARAEEELPKPAPVPTIENSETDETITEAPIPKMSQKPELPPAQDWFLSLIPQAGGRHIPRTASLSQGLNAAGEKLWKGLSAAQKAAIAQGKFRLKIDQIHEEPRTIRTSGWQGFALDKGLDGIALFPREKNSALEPFYAMPSWSIELQIPLKKWVKSSRSLAMQMAGWSEEQSKKAEVRVFRTRAFIENTDGTALAIARVNPDIPEHINLDERIAAASQFLMRETDSNGQITYVYQPHLDEKSRGYNLLRHAGTVYSMLQAYHKSNNQELLTAAKRAAKWFEAQLREDKEHPGEYFALEGDVAKLGGAGLGLCMFVELEIAEPGSTNPDILKGIAAHLMRMEASDGSFASYYDWNKQGASKRQSHYYPGEAILGLVRYYAPTKDPAALEAAKRGADFAINARWNALGLRLTVAPDAWLAQALEWLDRLEPNESYRKYAYEIADLMIRQRMHAPDAPPDIVGGGLETMELPNVASAGSKLEALAPVALIEARQVEKDAPHPYLDSAVEIARFVLRSQFMPHSSWWIENPERVHGAFRYGPAAAEIRNDYVQHNMSGLYLLQEALKAVSGELR